MATSADKQYIYKVYDGTGTFLGVLANVKSDFSYTQNVNSAGAQLEIVLSAMFDDVGAVQTDEFWLDESSNKIIDEAANHLVFSAEFDFNSIPIDLGNRVVVTLSYDGVPGGTTVFDGFISKWNTDYNANTVTITVLSWGAQLDNYIISSDPTGQTIDQEVFDKEYTLIQGCQAGFYPNQWNRVAQSFNIASPTVIGSMQVFGRTTTQSYNNATGQFGEGGYLDWELYAGTPSSPGSLVDSGQIYFTSQTLQWATLTLTTPLTLSGNYYIAFTNFAGCNGAQKAVSATSTNPYASGSIYTNTGASGAAWVAVAGDDLTFIVQGSSGNRTLTFSANDPSTIIKRILDQLNTQGGLVTYTSDTIDLTSTSVSYSYKLQTILEGVNKVLTLSPDGWYWYVDVATNYLHFHRAGISAEHLFVLGKHINALNIEYSAEQLVNVVYFSGGNTGSGSNLFTVAQNAASVSKYGQWLNRVSDNRITDSTTAGVITSGELASRGDPVFQTTVVVLAADYDIETIAVGDMVAFRNFSNLIDTLLFQVVSITRTPTTASLSLGTLPPRQSSEFDKMKRQLDLLETIDNPSAPS